LEEKQEEEEQKDEQEEEEEEGEEEEEEEVEGEEDEDEDEEEVVEEDVKREQAGRQNEEKVGEDEVGKVGEKVDFDSILLVVVVSISLSPYGLFIVVFPSNEAASSSAFLNETVGEGEEEAGEEEKEVISSFGY